MGAFPMSGAVREDQAAVDLQLEKRRNQGGMFLFFFTLNSTSPILLHIDCNYKTCQTHHAPSTPILVTVVIRLLSHAIGWTGQITYTHILRLAVLQVADAEPVNSLTTGTRLSHAAVARALPR